MDRSPSSTVPGKDPARGNGRDAGAAGSPEAASAAGRAPRTRAGRRLNVGARRFGGLYGLAILIILFSCLKPSLFPTSTTFTLILSNQAITGFLALGVLVPLAAGCLDLSFASVAGFAAVFGAWLTSNAHWSDLAIVAVVIPVSAAFGLVSGALVAGLRLNSLIVTLGVSSIALGVTELIAGGNTLTATFGPTLTQIGQGGVGPVPYMAILMLAFAVGLYIWMEHTVSGRFALATGSNLAAARLTGIRVGRLQLASLVFSAVAAAVAGILLDASVGSVSEVTTNGYLLPAVAAVFLGTTMVRLRPNVIGTVIAVYLLGTGIKGLQLLGAADWVSDFFNGAVLLLALIISFAERRRAPAATPSSPRPGARSAARSAT